MGKFTYWNSQSHRTLNHWQSGKGTGIPMSKIEHYVNWLNASGYYSKAEKVVIAGLYSPDLSSYYYLLPNIIQKNYSSLQYIDVGSGANFAFSKSPINLSNLNYIVRKTEQYNDHEERVTHHVIAADLGMTETELVPIVTNASTITVQGSTTNRTLTPDSNGNFKINVALPKIRKILIGVGVACNTADQTPENLRGTSGPISQHLSIAWTDAEGNVNSYSMPSTVYTLGSSVAELKEYLEKHGVYSPYYRMDCFYNGKQSNFTYEAQENYGGINGFNTDGIVKQQINSIPTDTSLQNSFVFTGNTSYGNVGGAWELEKNSLPSYPISFEDNKYWTSYGPNGYEYNVPGPIMCAGFYVNSNKEFSYSYGWNKYGIDQPECSYKYYGESAGNHKEPFSGGFYGLGVLNLVEGFEIQENAIIATTTGYIPKPTEPELSDNVVDTAVTWAINIANDSSHGYDQTFRWGEYGDYDCSSFVISAYDQAGLKLRSKGASYTGNMYGVFLMSGFSDVTSQINLATGEGMKKGDVLLNTENHTAMAIDSTQIVQASINENNGVTGGQPGDQTGTEIYVRGYYNYPWNYVLRYTG